jgi:aspartyl-tRNA(Asn)/glutamyl-tRNA(Gln) amidotransferase subunit A
MRFRKARSTNISTRIERPPSTLKSDMKLPDDIPYASARELAAAFRVGQLSPVEVATELLDRIDLLDGAVNAFVFVDRAATLAAAADSEQRWRRGAPRSALEGIPVTVKDLVAVAGWPLVRGSLALRGTPPPVEDAPAVARLREAGAVLLGKTATAESGCKIVTRSPAHGITRNPYDLELTPGGSSGGAAAALALGIGPLALGSDGAGSIRVPAAWTGVFGLKPSFGRVPSFPPSVFMPHSVVGPLARDVESAALMLSVMSQPESRDPYALPYAFDMERASQGDVGGLRIGVTSDFGMRSPPVEAAIAMAVNAAAEQLERAGATVVEARPRWPVDPYDPFIVLWDTTYAGFIANTYSAEQIALMDPDLQSIVERGKSIDTVRYHRALMQRATLTAASHALFRDFDVLLGPVIPFGAPLVTREAPEGREAGDWRWCPFTYLWNMTGQPAASCPWSADRKKLPVGVQLVARVGAEPDILRVARVLERASQPVRRPGELLESMQMRRATQRSRRQ